MITDKDVVPALASVGFNRYTTFGGICELGAAAYFLTHRSFAFCSRAYMKYTLSLLIFK
ncbi:hypothetical protein [Yersinia pseudotuberculosis]|uniref:hypothetical protein n=1 Tax=Yersinia pseudotuberculosis TaxID=633 RepID=UPI0030C7F2E0